MIDFSLSSDSAAGESAAGVASFNDETGYTAFGGHGKLLSIALSVVVQFGVTDLWPHQIQTLAAIVAGYSVFQMCATGSGKTLGCVLAVLCRKSELLELRTPGAVLWISPMNSLKEDTAERLRQLGLIVWVSPSSTSQSSSADANDGAVIGKACSKTLEALRADPPDVIVATTEFFFGSSKRCRAVRSYFNSLGGPAYGVVDEAHYGPSVGKTWRKSQELLRLLKGLYDGCPYIFSSATWSPDALASGVEFYDPTNAIIVRTPVDRPNLLFARICTGVSSGGPLGFVRQRMKVISSP